MRCTKLIVAPPGMRWIDRLMPRNDDLGAPVRASAICSVAGEPEHEERERVIVGPRVIADRLDVGQARAPATRPSIVKRHSRCVPSASTRITEMCAPSGVTVGEYSLSGVSVTPRVVARRDVVAIDVGLRAAPRSR